MPFQDFDNQWELAYRPAIEAAGLKPLRADETSLGTNSIVRDITKCLYGARIVIADISGRNPNVLYELGLAHAAKKPTIILVQDEQDVPFDLRHIRYLKYDARRLPSLKPALVERLKTTLAMPEADQADFFPELKVLSEAERAEFEYLMQRARPVRVRVTPEGADVFFNDRLVGRSPQVLRINPDAVNTVTAVAVEHLEDYHVITPEDVERGEVVITLQPAKGELDWNRLVPRWLRFRRKYPDNPVLMRAVAKYFSDTGSADEALTEARELLEAAPLWYMAQLMLGYVLLKPALDAWPAAAGDLDEAARYFRNAVVLEPNNVAGYFNLAIIYLLKGDYAKCLEQLKAILDDPERVRSYHQAAGADLFEYYADKFAPLRADPGLGREFEDILARLNAEPK
jgi:tetratricopeptide (TPR) repeat protein